MTVEEMHYDFKTKVNKVDTTQNRNFYIPEIDWLLNEAQELFIKKIAFPRRFQGIAFESAQRQIDDIRTIVRDEYQLIVNNRYVSLPDDYMYFIRGEVVMSNGQCNNILGRLIVRQHDDEFEKSPFDRSSFEWREVNATFNEEGIRLYYTGFNVDYVLLTYIRRPAYIHFASGVQGGSYTLPDGTTLTGTQDCELPEQVHREIVDIAVFLATKNMNITNRPSSYDNKR